MKPALIVVDLQNDFLPGGALAVPQGEAIIPIVNQLMNQFDLVVATQDWHPANHGSFAVNHPGHRAGDTIILNGLTQILWPVHCVQESIGAQFASEFNTSLISRIFQKGTDPLTDSYSGLYDNGHRHSTGLGEFLQEQGATDAYVVGLATDYCVKFTAMDLVAAGFTVHLVIDACRGVELHDGDITNAIGEMKQKGVKVALSQPSTVKRASGP